MRRGDLTRVTGARHRRAHRPARTAGVPAAGRPGAAGRANGAARWSCLRGTHAPRSRPATPRVRAGGDERHDNRQLGRPQIERGLRDGRADVAVQDARDQPQHVHRREHDRGRADDAVDPVLLEHAREHEELTGERAGPRNRERDHACRHQQGRERGPSACHPAEEQELAGRRAPLDRAGEKEQRRRDQPVVDHLEHRAVEAEIVRREEPERDQSHLRERRVRDHAADVGGAEREQRAVDQPDGREDQQRRPKVLRRPWKLRDRDAQEAVGRSLRHDPAEHRGDLRRRLAIGVRQPAVEGEERRLDGERDRKAEEDPVRRARTGVDEIERALREPEHDDRDEHQQRARPSCTRRT